MKSNSDTQFTQKDARGKHTAAPGYEAGNHWVVCDMCGFDIRAKDIKKTWDNRLVCPMDWEPRQPQDFVRSREDNIRALDPVRPPPEDVFIAACSTTESGVAGMAVCNDAVCNNSCGRAIPGGGIPSGSFNTNTL